MSAGVTNRGAAMAWPQAGVNRPLAWLGVAGLVLVLGYAVPPDTYLLLVGAAAFLVATPVAVVMLSRARAAGLAVLIVVAVLLPIEGQVAGRTVGATLPISAALCGTWLLRRVLSFRPIVFDTSAVQVSLVAFMGIVALSFAVGQYPWFTTPSAPASAQVAGLSLFLLSGGLFLVAAYDLRTLSALKRLTWLFIGTGAVAVVLIMLPAPASYYVGGVIRPESIGSMFWTWIVAIAASQTLFNRDLSAVKRAGLLAVVGLALARGLLLAFSWASGWLPPLVALGVIVCFRFPWFTAGASLLAAAPALWLGGPILSRLAAGEGYSLTTRLQALSVMWQVIERSPWLGLGPANYYYYTVLFPILGWYVKFSSHNYYVDLIAQTGVVGLLAFAWFVVAVTRSALTLRRQVTGGFEHAYVVGVLGGIAGSLAAGMLADWIVPFAYNIGLSGFRSSLLLWVFLGGLVALRRLTPAPDRHVGVRPMHGRARR
jgi:hypothetical protein